MVDMVHPDIGGEPAQDVRQVIVRAAVQRRQEGSSISVSVGDYFSTMLDQSMNWQDAADVRKKWGKQFCLKGIMSIADAKRAVDIGASAIMVSNHGGRQLDGSRSRSTSSPRSSMLSAT